MSFIKVGANLDDVPEESAVPGNAEYDLTIISSDGPKKSKKSDRQIINLGLRVDDANYPNAKLVNHTIVFPTEEDYEEEPDKARMMLRSMKRFLHCFGIEWTDEGFNGEDLEGATGRCVLVQDEYEGEINNKLRLPRMRE